MNYLKLLLIIAIAILLSSCKENVSEDCEVADWLGTYTGTVECTIDTGSINVIITSDEPGKIEIRYDGTMLILGSSPSLEIDGCAFAHREEDQPLTLEIEGVLDNNSLAISNTLTGPGPDDIHICVISATRN